MVERLHRWKHHTEVLFSKFWFLMMIQPKSIWQNTSKNYPNRHRIEILVVFVCNMDKPWFTAMNKEVGLLRRYRYLGDDGSYELFFSTATRVLRLIVWLKNRESSKSATFGDIGTMQEFCHCPQLWWARKTNFFGRPWNTWRDVCKTWRCAYIYNI